MKLIGFWLLLLLAVLVPATATVAAAMVCPPAVTAKQTQTRSHVAMQATSAKKHGAVVTTVSHDRSAKAKVGLKKTTSGGNPADPCCDTDPCSHCASCGTCASMAVAIPDAGATPPIAVASLPELGVPRAEFLLSGQERPPRSC